MSDIKGPRPSMVDALKAFCCNCSAHYDDGRVDCEHIKCELYSRMPHRKKSPKVGWLIGPYSKKYKNKVEKYFEMPDITDPKNVSKRCIKCVEDFFKGKTNPESINCYFEKECPIRSLRIKLIEYVKIHMIKNGKIRIPMTDIIRAKCFSCMGQFYQGRNNIGRLDCRNLVCPIYWWQPYREYRPDYSWILDVPYTKKHKYKRLELQIDKEEYIEKLLKGEIE